MSTGSIAVSPTLAAGRTRTARRVFLTARWQALAMLNWEVDPALVAPLVPRGTELDFDGRKTYVSLVGFLFLDTRLLGVPVPGHRHFEEVNLRFYVRRVAKGDVRRGVAFVKEIVPRWAIAQTARWCYNEPYVALPMRHEITGPLGGVQLSECAVQDSRREGGAGRVAYQWKTPERWHSLGVSYAGPAKPLVPGSHEEFIAEHYWGYGTQRDGGTVEYQVEHPPWNIWRPAEVQCDLDAGMLYGPQFGEALSRPPTSSLLADGSAVVVMQAVRV